MRDGRRREFAKFPAFVDPGVRNRIPDPNDIATFERSKLDWSEAEREGHADHAEVRRGGMSTLVYWIAALPDPMCRADAYVGAAEAMVRPGRAATP